MATQQYWIGQNDYYGNPLYSIVQVDEYGFLYDPADWNDYIGRCLAGIQFNTKSSRGYWYYVLSADQLKVVTWLRNYYMSHNYYPSVRKMASDNGFIINQLYQLFPTGPIGGAIRIAGLPRPLGVNGAGCL